MKQPLFILAVLLAVLSSACGGGGGGNDTVQAHSAPVISGLAYSPTSATQGQGGGSITVSGTISFTDADGDCSTLALAIYDSLGNQQASSTYPITGASGVTSGSIGINAIVNTSVKGTYTFRISVTDSAGLQSNVLTGTFTIT